MLTQGKKGVCLSLVIIQAVALATLCTGCGKQGSSLATIQYGNYTAFDRLMDSPIFKIFQPVLVTPAYAATSNILLCVHRIRFKAANESDSADLATDTDDDDVSGDNRVGQQGWVAVSTAGSFGTANVPHPKLAERLEIDVDNHCAGAGHPSVQFTTANGNFSSNSGFTLQFRSSSSVDLTHDNVVIVDWQPVNNALNGLAANAQDSAIVSALTTVGNM